MAQKSERWVCATLWESREMIGGCDAVDVYSCCGDSANEPGFKERGDWRCAYAFEAGICRLMARYQLSASDGDGASKYRIALLSTKRSALP